ncbi:MAG TPA: hypothetical protein VK507_18980 [Iamia sp.]|nr:hypothetical protein [Iamia sp.]
MRRSIKAILLVAALAATALVATQVQAQGQAPEPEPTMVAAPPTAGDTGGAITETEFVPITGCRIYDTRMGQGGSPIGAGNFRTLKVKGPENIPGQYSGQGGKAGGCGVPVAATAIEATVTAVSAAGTGLLRLWPSGSTETTSTFLNYMKGFNPTNTGALAICNVVCGAASDLRVRANGSATHVVIEVQGYYVKPLAAVVQASGALSVGSRVVATSRPSTGQYLVKFDRNVDQCVANATADGASIYAAVTPDVADQTRFYVFTFDASGALSNRAFHLNLTC